MLKKTVCLAVTLSAMSETANNNSVVPGTNAVSPNEIIHGSPPGPLISNTQVKKLGFAANLNECKEKCRSFMYQVPSESG